MTELPAARLAADHTVWSVWMEDSDSWDGVGLYLDEQTALVHAAADYAMDEYRYPDPEDPEQVAPSLTWSKRYSRWQLADEGRDTGIRVAEVNVYRPATAEETKPARPVSPIDEVRAWNEQHAIGTPVRVWTGAREGDGTLTRTRSRASVLGTHTAVVWVDGEGSCISLSHVDPEPAP